MNAKENVDGADIFHNKATLEAIDQVGHGRDIVPCKDDIIYIDEKKHVNIRVMKKKMGVIYFRFMEAESNKW